MTVLQEHWVSVPVPGYLVMFQGPVNTCYDIFVNPETKPIVEASGHIYEGTIINRWISE